MKRFSTKGRNLSGFSLSVVIFIIIFLLFCGTLSCLSQDTTGRQKRELETALQHGILTCYALEGHYPESLQYLQDHYPIHYNSDLFYVDYRIQGANLLPDITIIERGK